MQWDNGENLGFSSAPAEKLYLPVDPEAGHTTVAAQEKDPDSMLNHIRRVLALRKEHADLGNYTSFEVVHAKAGDRLFVYKRGSYLLAVNPGLETRNFELDGDYEIVYTFGQADAAQEKLHIGGQSMAILKPVK